MNTKLNNLIPMLVCDDAQASIRFYTDVLGFTVSDEMPDVGKSGWAMIEHGNIQLMLASPQYTLAPVKVEGRFPQSMYYFYPKDVEALHEFVKSKGHPVGDLETRFYGMREFEIVDPSGHVLVFDQATDEDS